MGRLCTQQIMAMQDENVVDHQMPPVSDNEDVSVMVESDEEENVPNEKSPQRHAHKKEKRGKGKITQKRKNAELALPFRHLKILEALLKVKTK